ncbi:mRNA decay activator protein ZFP36 [Kryptolebias marmoratus]|uniref:mRNA decay activator protein ZFP36 n=1 Tax=Kryptolebias marmoratus TaxID=37003 RepID=A0A3Q3GRV7_KRYMA|nr:mRNA decay activator protein ZFP36 [Kryptolebias marmoratus]
MPSHPFNQFSDLEEMMCKHFLSLDLREQNRAAPSLAMRTPGFAGEPCRNASFSLSCLPADSPDGPFVTSSQWGLQSESLPSPQLGNSPQWGKTCFLSQRSVSMVETSGAPGACLGWSGTEKTSPGETSPSVFNASSSSSSSSSVSSSSSSSRYKTELCRSFTENGLCKYGGKCQFAHGPEELRDLSRHPKYKTEPCRTFHTIGFCPYGIRCHFIHNSEEEKKHSFPRSASSFNIPPQLPSRSHRPPLVRQSFSFAGFPSVPHSSLQPVPAGHAPPTAAAASFTCGQPASPSSCADITDLLSFLEVDSAFEASPASPAHHCRSPASQATQADPRSPFLPSPDSGYSPCGPSPTNSPSLRQSPSAAEVLSEPLGTRSLSYTSLSDPDQDQDGGSSASSLSGSESCGGSNEASGKRLAVFSQLSVPEDAADLSL